ncbi:MAG TPA: tetratricopeptide repeat protein [bacterium]|nr:tetratricopeptide repeat protein [bacterium]
MANDRLMGNHGGSRLGLAWALFLLAPAAFAATSWEYYQAGMRLYNQHEYNEASRYFGAAVNQDPNNWQAYQGLGLCDYALGDKAGAKQAFDRSLTIHPDNPQLARFDESLDSATAPPRSPSASVEHSPVVGGGNFGLGLVIGGPGSWGVTGKYWLDDKDAFQGALKLEGGGSILQLQYLWHDYDLIHPSSGAFPFYIGVGGDLALGGGSAAVAGCVPIGITYLFQKKTVPLDLFVEVVPTLWVFSGGINLQIYGDIGSRFYF